MLLLSAIAGATGSYPTGVIGWSTLQATAATSGTGETLLLACKVPADHVVVGSSFHVRLAGNSSSTGTLIFRVKVGPNGTTGDNQVWISTTSVAQAANARASVDVIVTIRSIGAGGTAIGDGVAFAGAIVLPTLVGAPATASVATTATWFLDITCACSVGTFTAQVALVEAM